MEINLIHKCTECDDWLWRGLKNLNHVTLTSGKIADFVQIMRSLPAASITILHIKLYK